ncbi:MAG: hypothetical protein IIY36_07600 [Lachnospiraceae bacterium]|nr:hypothetical protein [Lachnospiraceae bacterium]
MDINIAQPPHTPTRDEQNHLLYLKQKALLETFLEKGAISRAQYEKSLHDLTEKMGETPA